MLADPRHEQLAAVRAPPVAMVAAHLLLRAELGRAEPHLRGVRGQLKDAPPGPAGDPERTADEIADRTAVRAHLRVGARARHRDLAGAAVPDVAGEQAS